MVEILVPNMNPLQKEESRPNARRPTIPIFVKYVAKDESMLRTEFVQNIRQLCFNENIFFQARLYNSAVYKDDRDKIERLPALHIYIQGAHQRTFYPNTRPAQHIYEVVDAYLERLQKQDAKKGKFKRVKAKIVQWFKRLFHRKTRLERVSEWQ